MSLGKNRQAILFPPLPVGILPLTTWDVLPFSKNLVSLGPALPACHGCWLPCTRWDEGIHLPFPGGLSNSTGTLATSGCIARETSATWKRNPLHHEEWVISRFAACEWGRWHLWAALLSPWRHGGLRDLVPSLTAACRAGTGAEPRSHLRQLWTREECWDL